MIRELFDLPSARNSSRRGRGSIQKEIVSTYCAHGHETDCGCGDCKIARCIRRQTVVLPEPQRRALIACQIQTGLGQTWTSRTYEVVRAPDGQWMVDFGEGALKPRRDWEAVLGWLWSLKPRDVELLEAP